MPAASAIQTLIVDDQLTMRSLIRASLQQIGVVNLREANDGEEGLRAMIAQPAHLVISDFNMPNLDGLADVGVANANFAEKFLADEGIPIIASSLRGHGARRVQFWPNSGRALQKSVSDRPVERPVPAPVQTSGELELF